MDLKEKLNLNKKENGITLVALIITIVILLILAVVAIRSAQGDSIIVNARRSSFLNKVKTYEEELVLYINNQKLNNHEYKFDSNTLNARKNTVPSIKDIIKSISAEDEEEFIIKEGKLKYIGTDEQKITWCEDIKLAVTDPEKVNLNTLKIYGNSVQESILPSNYQQLDYIEADGTQYLEINYKASNKTNSKGVFQITDTNVAGMLFGARQETNTKTYGFNWGGGAPFKYYNNYYGATSYALTTTQIDKKKHSFEKQLNKLYLDNKLIHTREDTDGSIAFTTPTNICIFACNTSSTIHAYASARLFSLQFYDEDVLKIDLIPCYRKSDNEVGLYDLVNNVFYTNKGTGKLIKGGNVPTQDIPVEIESVGDYDQTIGKYKIPIKASNKNLFKLKNADKTGLSAYNGYGSTKYDLNENGYTLYKYTGIGFNFDNLEVGEKYTLSVKFGNTLESGRFFHIGQNMYQNNSGVVSSKAYSVNVKEGNYLSLTFTADKTNLLAFSLQNGDGSLTITDIQLERGETRTEYEEYKEPVVRNVYLNEPLRKIGDYEDYIDFNNKKAIRRIGVRTYNGTEEWTEHMTTSEGYKVFRNENLLTPLIGAPISASYMTHFALTDKAATVNFVPGEYRFTYSNNNIIGSRIYVSALQTTVEEFKEWLVTNKPSIYYPLAETIQETITLPAEIEDLENYSLIEVMTEIQPSKIEK